MKTLLIITAGVEAGAGLLLGVAPSQVALILLNSPLDSPPGLILGRLLGAAIFALGMACWIARDDAQGRTATGLIAAMLLYNIAAVSLLSYARIGFGMSGFGLLPGVILHLTLLVWCVTCLRLAHRNGRDMT